MANPPPDRPVTPLTDEERALSLRGTLACAPPGSIHVFGYGSLMWKPCFPFADRARASLDGYHRDFCIWTVVARGTPERPGLGLGLEPRRGASCVGIVYRLEDGVGEANLTELWDREMWTDTYRPTWVDVETSTGRIRALTFVVQTGHRQYAGDLNPADRARYIASAAGKYGSCRDYLADTVRELQELGIDDREMTELLRSVDALRP